MISNKTLADELTTQKQDGFLDVEFSTRGKVVKGRITDLQAQILFPEIVDFEIREDMPEAEFSERLTRHLVGDKDLNHLLGWKLDSMFDLPDGMVSYSAQSGRFNCNLSTEEYTLLLLALTEAANLATDVNAIRLEDMQTEWMGGLLGVSFESRGQIIKGEIADLKAGYVLEQLPLPGGDTDQDQFARDLLSFFVKDEEFNDFFGSSLETSFSKPPNQLPDGLISYSRKSRRYSCNLTLKEAAYFTNAYAIATRSSLQSINEATEPDVEEPAELPAQLDLSRKVIITPSTGIPEGAVPASYEEVLRTSGLPAETIEALLSAKATA